MGKDFQFRTIYGRAGNGNQFVGGKYSFGKAMSNGFKWANRGIGIYNAISINNQRISGELDNTQFWLEEGSNVISTVAPGLYGAGWSIGWESGRWITQHSWYQTFKYDVWRFYWQLQVGPPSYGNRYDWEYFYNNYRP